jgi:hypothetical protein
VSYALLTHPTPGIRLSVNVVLLYNPLVSLFFCLFSHIHSPSDQTPKSLRMCYNNITHSCGHTVKFYFASCERNTDGSDLTASIQC